MSTIQTSYYRNKPRFDFSREEVDWLKWWVGYAVQNLEYAERADLIDKDKPVFLFLKQVQSKMQKFLDDTGEGK